LADSITISFSHDVYLKITWYIRKHIPNVVKKKILI